jgi:alpha-L-fucosidase
MLRLLLVFWLTFAAQAQNFAGLRPSPQQIAWQDLEIGVLIHFGTNTFLDREWGDGKADPSVFDPRQANPEQWVLAAKAAGAKYLVMVAKHHDGFCLWPSRYTSYSVKNSPWMQGKGDLVRLTEQACRKHGLKFGVYLSPWDRHEPSYADAKAYDKYYLNQLTELITRYGEITELWLDGAGSEGHVYDFDAYVDRLRTYQPNTLIFADVGFLQYGDIRWVGNESGFAPETNWNVVDRRGYLRWRPAEADTPLREGHWFWHPNAESRLKTLDQLLDTYHKTVGRGAQLVLGLAPDNRGLMPDVDVARLNEFGDALRTMYGPTAQRACGDAWPRAAKVDRVVLMEDLTEGQRVMRYDVQVRVGGKWDRIVASGTTIGHKKIDLFEAVEADGIRLLVRESMGEAKIRHCTAGVAQSRR